MRDEQAPHLVRLQAVQFEPLRKNPEAHMAQADADAHEAQLTMLAEQLGQVAVGAS